VSTSRQQPAAQRPAAARILLLPGANERGDGFARAGFHDAVRVRGLAIELECCELEFDHVTDRSMLDRLRSGPVAAARAAGYEAVWLAGVSMGGFMALCYAEQYPNEVNGVCLIAPYLGTRIISREIGLAGGVAGWSPGEIAVEDEDRRIWRFIKSRSGMQPALYLGYGRDDRFADSQQLLAVVLPPEWVDVVSGAHSWPVWRQIWNHFLDKWPTLGRSA
jgi:pimeloyl-ACP methyl ester carboxylesterase